MTLVSIVGDFHSNVLPLFYHFRDEITNHVIIYDDFKYDALQAQKIITGTKKFIANKKLPINTYTVQIDEDSYTKLSELSQYILNFQTPNETVLINITDGFASISYILVNRLQQYGVKFLAYDRFDNTYTSLHKEGISTPISVESINIQDHFLLKNVHISATSSKQIAQEYEQDIKEFFESSNGVKENATQNSFIQTTPVGFLYEFYIYNLVKQLQYDDIEMGVKVEDIYDNQRFENEFDILIMKNNHLHMIECKARDDYEAASISSFIYKLDSVRTTLDEDAKMFFLTADDVYDSFADGFIKTKISPYYRANARRIFLRGTPVGRVERFLRDVDSIFSLHTPNIDTLAPKDKLPITDASKQKEIINQYLQTLFALNIDFFNRSTLAKILNYKINYTTNQHVKDAMNIKEIQLLLRKINRMQDEAEMNFVYNYFQSRCLNNN